MTEARRIDFDIRAKHTTLKTVPEISAETGVPENEIEEKLKRWGLKPVVREVEPAAFSTVQKIETKQAQPPVPITDEEIVKVAKLFNGGMTYIKIADEMGCSFNHISVIMKMCRIRKMITRVAGNKQKSDIVVTPKVDKPVESVSSPAPEHNSSVIISALERRIVDFEAEINRYAVRTEELHKRIDEIKRELTLWTR